MTITEQTTKTEPPPTRRRPRRGHTVPLIAIAIVLGSIGYGLTLLPAVGLAGLLVLVPAAILLLVGLNESVREELRKEY
ncbi:hypothetical protein [Brachybacterium sacelli]|uniref:Nitrogen fixation-related uncharacterized protein n=2 Tax=Brachybacterium sacelli TaxID=173364 RepID=A0ABS4WX48_9MICO|nr:hypothetical protein [Brachybacterium sacelli]MBP2380777.1 nitrogen fixation-related uncharacterized protein [Brachybacterium sacelli]